MFRAGSPSGPWTRTPMKRSFHDLSVLFDDDGKVYVIWGYQEIRFAQLDEDLTDVVPGTEKVVIQRGAGMGEGVHWYKIDGRYYILSAEFAGRMRMPAARADKPDGPYEVNRAISIDEDFGLRGGLPLAQSHPALRLVRPNTIDGGRMSMHQGGIVSTATGEWWGFSMMDFNSVGRLTTLSPVTWRDGWPYFGLPGNLKRTPRTWVKPNTGRRSERMAPYPRDDDFGGPALAGVWQWNHVPVESRWSLTERAGFLRLHSLPAADLWWARNTLTQRSIGPVSAPTAELDASGMRPGDVAGLALLNLRTAGSASAATRTDSPWCSSTSRAAAPRPCRSPRAGSGCARGATSSGEGDVQLQHRREGVHARGRGVHHGVPARDVPGRPLRALSLQHRRRAGRPRGLRPLHR